MTKEIFPMPIVITMIGYFYQQLSNTSIAFFFFFNLRGSSRPFQILHIQENHI